ncbi:MAG: FecR domain-containing protein [Chloroflexota bacterium]|jgi:hypothetical protein
MEDNRELERHLTTEELLDLIERRLASDERQRALAHLASDCSSCREELVWLTKTLDLMEPNLWVDAPSRLRASVRQSFREHYSSQSEAFSFGRWLGSLFTPARPVAYAAIAIVLVVVVVGLVLQPWSDAGQESSAEIAAYTGTVEVQSTVGDSWQSATDASEIDAGGGVRTGEESSVVINFPDRSRTMMSAYTELSVLTMSLEEEQGDRIIILQQQSGRTENHVEPLPSAGSIFEIRTPVATISVRGTAFTVDVAQDGTTHVDVSEGRVQVAAQGVTVTLDAGEATVVETGDPPGDVEEVPTMPAEVATGTPTPVAVPNEESVEEAPAASTPTSTPAETPNALPTFTATPTLVVATATPTPKATTNSGSSPSATPTATPTPTDTPVPPLPSETPPPPTNTPVVGPTPVPTETPRVPPGQTTRTPGPPTRKAPPGASDKVKK